MRRPSDYETKEVAIRILTGIFMAAGKPVRPETVHFFSEKLAKTFDESFGQIVLPGEGESSVVALDNPKTAGLFFDRVWMIGRHEGRMADLTFTGGTQLEIWIGALSAASSDEDGVSLPFDIGQVLLDSPIHTAFSKVADAFDTPAMARMIAQTLQEERGLHSVAMFSSARSQHLAYSSGDMRALLASVTNLGVVDEGSLTWEQVGQVREDKDAIAKLRALRYWVNSTMAEKSIGFVTDAIGVRLCDYEWSLKKHGIKTVIGSMQSLLDPRFLAASAAVGGSFGFAVGPHAGLDAVAVTVLGKTALAISEACLNLADSKRGVGAEVAFVHEIQKLKASS